MTTANDVPFADPPVLVGSAERAREVLGWEPNRSVLDVQIEDAWNWLKSRNLRRSCMQSLAFDPMMEDCLGADSEEKRKPVNDIDTAVVDRLKALDPNRPIREADINGRPIGMSFG